MTSSRTQLPVLGSRATRLTKQHDVSVPLRERMRPPGAEQVRQRVNARPRGDHHRATIAAQDDAAVGAGAVALGHGASLLAAAAQAGPTPRMAPVGADLPSPRWHPTSVTASPCPKGSGTTSSSPGATRSCPAPRPSTVERRRPESAARQFGYNNDYLAVLPLGTRDAEP